MSSEPLIRIVAESSDSLLDEVYLTFADTAIQRVQPGASTTVVPSPRLEPTLTSSYTSSSSQP